MARSSSEDTVAESILLSDGLEREDSSTSPSAPSSRFDYDDDDAYAYDNDNDDAYLSYARSSGPRRPTSFGRVLEFVGMNGRRRRRNYEFHSSSSSREALHGLLAPSSGRRRSKRDVRSCRKGFVVGTFRRVLLFTPLAVLMLL